MDKGVLHVLCSTPYFSSSYFTSLNALLGWPQRGQTQSSLSLLMSPSYSYPQTGHTYTFLAFPCFSS